MFIEPGMTSSQARIGDLQPKVEGLQRPVTSLRAEAENRQLSAEGLVPRAAN